MRTDWPGSQPSALPDTWEQAQPGGEQKLDRLETAWDHLVGAFDACLDDHVELAEQVGNLSKQMDLAGKQMDLASRQANVVSRRFELNNKLLREFVQETKAARERSRPQ